MATGVILAGCDHRFHGAAVDPARPVRDFSAPNWDQRLFRLEDHRGKVVMVFFGYTHCPDICPGSFAKMRRVHLALGERSADVKVVFISVDPERDTSEKLAAYVPSFNPDFYGLRLEGTALERLKAAFEVRAERRHAKGDRNQGQRYNIDHTSTFFVLDRSGKLRLKLPFDAPVEEVVSDLQFLLDEGQTASLSAEAPLSITRARARPTVAAVDTGAIYMEIANGAGRDDRLLSVETSVAASTELHESVHENGMARMLPRPEGFVVPARSTVKLEPGGKHIMLVDLAAPLEAGKNFRLKLRFERSGVREIEVPVISDDGASCCQEGPTGTVTN